MKGKPALRAGAGLRQSSTLRALPASQPLSPAPGPLSSPRQDVRRVSRAGPATFRRKSSEQQVQANDASPQVPDRRRGPGRPAGHQPLHHQGARRDAGEDRLHRSDHRQPVGARGQRGRGRQVDGRPDEQEGRHSRPARPAPGRGQRQRHRHRRAEGAQADRARQGRRHHGRRELRHRLRDHGRDQRRRRCSTSSLAATPIRSPARIASGTRSAPATPPRWTPPPSPASW